MGSSRLHPAGDTWLVAHCPVSALVCEKPIRPAGPEPPGLPSRSPPAPTPSLILSSATPVPRSSPALLPGLCLPSLSPSLCAFEGTPSLLRPLPSSLTRQLGLGEVGGRGRHRASPWPPLIVSGLAGGGEQPCLRSPGQVTLMRLSSEGETEPGTGPLPGGSRPSQSRGRTREGGTVTEPAGTNHMKRQRLLGSLWTW